MNKSLVNKMRIQLARGTATAFIVFAVVLPIAELRAQPPNPVTNEFKEKAKVAFTAALTRSARPGEEAFRTRLLDPASAKKAVEEEGKIEFPADWVVMFYLPKEGNLLKSGAVKFTGEINENYHIFYLPPLPDGKQHFYKDHLMCCYPPWGPTTPPPPPPPRH